MCSVRMSRLQKPALLVTLFGFISVILVEHTAAGQKISGLRPVNEGESLVLQCSLSTCSNSTYTCTYAWSSPSVTLPADTTTATITLTNLQRIWNGGVIACNITVDGTTSYITQTTPLDVRYGPSTASISVSSPYTVTEGSTIAIECQVPACNPTCIATWFNGSTQLLSTTLGTPAVSRNFAGNYTCNVSNSVGSRTLQLNLIVNYGPSAASISVSSPYTVTEGNTISIACPVPACHPTCIARWFNDSIQLLSTTLFGTPVSRYFAGNYICNVSNAVGFQTKLLQLIVNYAPDVKLTWDERTRKFTCTAAGNPTIYTFHALEQRISGVPIRNISFQPGSGGSRNAVLQDLSYQDTGKYTCAVENGISKNGTTKQSNTLDVSIKDAPILLGHTLTYNVSKGDKITVTIPVYAFPAVPKTGVGIMLGNSSISASDNITVSLENRTGLVSFHNKSITSGIQTLSVVIDATQEQYFGNCSVNFTNDVGKTAAHFEIFPQGPPDTPLHFEQQSTTYDSVTFTVESGFFNGGDQTLVLQYRRVKGDSVWANGSLAVVGIVKNYEVAMTVDSLSQVTDYEFRVYAFNVYNKSDYSAVLEVATSLHVGMVVGSVIGGIAGIVLIVLIVYFARKKMRDEKPPPIVPFANILATLGEERHEHAGNNMYTQSSTASEGLYINMNTKKATPSKVDDEEPYTNQVRKAPYSASSNVDDEEPYMNQVGKAPNRKPSVDSHGYLKVGDHSNGEQDYMNVAEKLGKTQSITKNAPKGKEEDDYINLDARSKPVVYENTQLTPGKTKSNEKKSNELEGDYMEMSLKKQNSTPKNKTPAPPSKGTDEEDYENTLTKRKKKSTKPSS